MPIGKAVRPPDSPHERRKALPGSAAYREAQKAKEAAAATPAKSGAAVVTGTNGAGTNGSTSASRVLTQKEREQAEDAAAKLRAAEAQAEAQEREKMNTVVKWMLLVMPKAATVLAPLIRGEDAKIETAKQDLFRRMALADPGLLDLQRENFDPMWRRVRHMITQRQEGEAWGRGSGGDIHEKHESWALRVTEEITGECLANLEGKGAVDLAVIRREVALFVPKTGAEGSREARRAKLTERITNCVTDLVATLLKIAPTT